MTTKTKAAPSVNDAARNVLSALGHIGPARLTHGYGCPSEHAGPCTCGTAELSTAATELEEALSPAPAP